MGRDFPLPRHELPALAMTDSEHRVCKDFATRLLDHTVHEFERFAFDEGGRVSHRRWKTKARREDMTLYRERDAGFVGISLADALYRCAHRSPLFMSTAAALTPATMLLTGTRQGYVENAMETTVTKNQEELALVVKFLHGDVADCAVLSTLEEATPQAPFHFLGIKYFVTESMGDARMIKRRHSVYLESSGITRMCTGEVVGYHLMQSVSLPGFPDLSSRNSVGALTSMRFIYRQKCDNVVEIFMLANTDLSGNLFAPLARFAIDEVTFGMTRLLDCSETKRLTQMARDHQLRKLARRQNNRMMRIGSVDGISENCSVCQRASKRGFKSVKLVQCLICGHHACSRCRAAKRVFVSSNDGILGRLIKVPTCSRCIMRANISFFEQRKLKEHYDDVSDEEAEPSPMEGLPVGWNPEKAPSTPGTAHTNSDTPRHLAPLSPREDWAASPKSIDHPPRPMNAEQTWRQVRKAHQAYPIHRQTDASRFCSN